MAASFGLCSKTVPSLVLLSMALPVLLLTSVSIVAAVESQAMEGGRNNVVGVIE